MTVKELIEKLKQFPPDLPVATVDREEGELEAMDAILGEMFSNPITWERTTAIVIQ